MSRDFGSLVKVGLPRFCISSCVIGVLTLSPAFFQGLYIDHNLANGTVGFAPLKSGSGTGTNATSTSVSASSPTSTPSTKPTQPSSGASKTRSSEGLFWSFAILAALFAVSV